ncbi:PA0069 family radical SAM protein [Palleronia caenipelagi]|uniref:PA0069 family radical SAM protein n=1 Tax=Palleronia caenipelagi TaxID=2489174 RepID=A0A547PXW4_9RHOB|nr:PA0069 family radical SAM protein [Palleronia caenipelagi]TRD19000.1 PA0069 family radical SAM protein [Palleronia caenipelagi]
MTQADFSRKREASFAGRATGLNPVSRFEILDRAPVDDGWHREEPPPIRTAVTEERPRSMITRNSSPDIGFDRSLNPYRGCEHGCIYCFARPGHGYLGLSSGLDFETKLIARPDAPEVLERELRKLSYTPAPIALGTNTDCYQPIERDRRVTRGILEVLQRFRHPLILATKGALVERDIDILAEMSGAGLASVGIGVTTLDRDLARRMEPRVPAPQRRLQTIERLARAGVQVRVMVSPVVPGLTDPEVEAILTVARDAGATSASWVMLRLPHEVAPLFEDWLDTELPGRASKVRARLREMHGGALYSARWQHRMRGEGLHAQMIAKRFALATRRLGLATGMPALRSDLFERPLGDARQPSLF